MYSDSLSAVYLLVSPMCILFPTTTAADAIHSSALEFKGNRIFGMAEMVLVDYSWLEMYLYITRIQTSSNQLRVSMFVWYGDSELPSFHNLSVLKYNNHVILLFIF